MPKSGIIYLTPTKIQLVLVHLAENGVREEEFFILRISIIIRSEHMFFPVFLKWQ